MILATWKIGPRAADYGNDRPLPPAKCLGSTAKLDFRLRIVWAIPVPANGQLERQLVPLTLLVEANILKYAFFIAIHCQ